MYLNFSIFRPLPKFLSQGEGLTTQNILSNSLNTVVYSPFSLGERGWG